MRLQHQFSHLAERSQGWLQRRSPRQFNKKLDPLVLFNRVASTCTNAVLHVWPDNSERVRMNPAKSKNFRTGDELRQTRFVLRTKFRRSKIGKETSPACISKAWNATALVFANGNCFPFTDHSVTNKRRCSGRLVLNSGYGMFHARIDRPTANAWRQMDIGCRPTRLARG